MWRAGRTRIELARNRYRPATAPTRLHKVDVLLMTLTEVIEA